MLLSSTHSRTDVVRVLLNHVRRLSNTSVQQFLALRSNNGEKAADLAEDEHLRAELRNEEVDDGTTAGGTDVDGAAADADAADADGTAADATAGATAGADSSAELRQRRTQEMMNVD